MRLALITIFLLTLGCCVYAQENSNPIILEQRNGLPSNYVYDVFEDHNGFVWMATEQGLYRYDGFEYKLYASEMQSTLAGSGIQQDVFGRIWYENFDGYLFYLENGRLNSLKQDHPIQFLPFGLTDRYLYVIVKDGVSIYDLKSLKLLNTINITWIYAEHASLINGKFYITDQNKIVCIDQELNVSQTSVKVDDTKGVKLVFPVDGKVAVFYRNNGVVNFYDKNLQFLYQNNIAVTGSVHHVVNIANTKYAIATSKGLWSVDFAHHKAKVLDVKCSGYSIAEYLVDRNKNEWIPTIGSGVFFNAISKSKTKVLLKGNFSLIRPYNDGYIVADQSGKMLKLSSSFSIGETLADADGDVGYLFKDPRSNSFLYTDNTGVYVVQGAVKKYFNIALKQAVYLDDKYYLIAASGFYGLFKNPFATQVKSDWDPYFKKNIFNLTDFSAFKSFVRAKTVAYNLRLQVVVVGANVGTFINNKGVESELKLNGERFFVSKLVWCEDVLFALSTTGNLYKSEDLKEFQKVEIPENNLRLAKHVDHTIYMLGSNFLYAYDTKRNSATRYDLGNNTRSINDFVVDGENIIMTTVDGLFSTNLISTAGEKVNVPFYVNDFYVNDVKVESFSNLSYDQNNIRINFSYLNFGRKNGVVVSYRLNNDAWVVVPNQERDIYFQALAPGSYELAFKVNGKVLPEKVQINIAVPIWKAWWFYLLLIVVSVVSLWLFYAAKTKRYTHQIKLLNDKIQLEKSLAKSVLTSIKAQMNPHFFYNALNTIQGFIFTNDKLSANNYLAKFSKLTRLVLEMSEKENVSLNEELDAIKMYLDLEKMRFGEKIDYAIVLKNISSVEAIELPPMLIQPLLENAIKHGLLHLDRPGKLVISLLKNNNQLEVRIEDDGIGRERAAKLKANREKTHDSFALKANQARLEILNKNRKDSLFTLEMIDKVENGIAKGTIAKLTIPLD
ncbi:histidine kinase [Pedobacter sp. UBA4863]|uniref:sensor histidine kinase n=1 Tax=Pedobacter sp. UBA4863 TaxID=1947060 RepID=UPI0025FE050C|nr:histidine kinase [Pedobacter sp. UBA4863]